MNDSAILHALADAIDAASRVLRERAVAIESPLPESIPVQGAVARARAMHPPLGPRQAQIIEVLEKYGRTGTNTGVISRAIGYSQPNVHLTLMGLMGDGLVERDDQARPHRYWLSEPLLDD